MSDRAAAVAPQFEDLEQQRDASRLGMWIFLATEVMFFGGLFTAYVAYRFSHPQAFRAGSNRLDFVLGGVNTLVLIASSFTMAMAVHSVQEGRRRALVRFLGLTMALGAAFLVIKGFEYGHKVHEGLVPGRGFRADETARRGFELFFSLYFVMTGMHALHMVIGIGVLGVLAGLALRGRLPPERHALVENTGLYWHFVDIVWIFLYPLLYLIGRHG